MDGNCCIRLVGNRINFCILRKKSCINICPHTFLLLRICRTNKILIKTKVDGHTIATLLIGFLLFEKLQEIRTILKFLKYVLSQRKYDNIWGLIVINVYNKTEIIKITLFINKTL